MFPLHLQKSGNCYKTETRFLKAFQRRTYDMGRLGFLWTERDPGRASKVATRYVNLNLSPTHSTDESEKQSWVFVCTDNLAAFSLFFLMNCDGLKQGYGSLHIENMKVRAWDSIITAKSKFTSHTFHGRVGLQI